MMSTSTIITMTSTMSTARAAPAAATTTIMTADEVFVSWGMETARKFSETELRSMLDALQDESRFGIILRAKGIVDASDGEWIYFDYVPGEIDIRRGGAAVTGRFCVIGSKLHEQALKELFKVE